MKILNTKLARQAIAAALVLSAAAAMSVGAFAAEGEADTAALTEGCHRRWLPAPAG